MEACFDQYIYDGTWNKIICFLNEFSFSFILFFKMLIVDIIAFPVVGALVYIGLRIGFSRNVNMDIGLL